MEADWEVEIGGDAPVIDVDWPGRVDLRRDPDAAFALAEAHGFAELAQVLVRLNAPGSGLATCKCDVWDVDSFDPDEMDATAEADCAVACYVDLVPADGRAWNIPDAVVTWCRRVCGKLRAEGLSGCRADLVVRRAVRESPHGAAMEVGVTSYVTGCGENRQRALAALGAAVTAWADCVLAEGLQKVEG